jgi:YesN/AraC family two-component response regulator
MNVRAKNIMATERVLIVDDDAVFRSEFCETFEEFGVAEAASAKEAFEYLKKPNEIDVVVLDVRMSGLNGIEALRTVRTINPALRIIILTGYGSKDVAVEALRAQADDYIEKPPNIEATKLVIEGFLDSKRGAPPLDAIDLAGKMDRVKEYVRRNACKKVTLEDAAQLVCLSPKYLSRVFKETEGEGFNEYKLSSKFAEAKMFLHTTGYTVEQISDKLGYENSESFIREFKKRADLTPKQYRLQKPKTKKIKI